MLLNIFEREILRGRIPLHDIYLKMIDQIFSKRDTDSSGARQGQTKLFVIRIRNKTGHFRPWHHKKWNSSHLTE